MTYKPPAHYPRYPLWQMALINRQLDKTRDSFYRGWVEGGYHGSFRYRWARGHWTFANWNFLRWFERRIRASLGES